MPMTKSFIEQRAEQLRWSITSGVFANLAVMWPLDDVACAFAETAWEFST